MAFTDWVGMQDQAKAAKARALANNQYQRGQLQMQYGLKADGTLNGNDQLGSIYQNGVATNQNYQQGLAQQMVRGFGTGGGLGGKAKERAQQQGLLNQGSLIQQATSQFGYLGVQDQLADTDYQNATGSIGRGQADQLAQQLAAQPVYTPPPPEAPAPPPGGGYVPADPRLVGTPAQIQQKLKKNPMLAWKT